MPVASNNPDSPRRLRVFLCHSSGDKPAVRDLCRRLKSDGVEPWLDEERLLPGQDWRDEIPQALHNSDAVIVCLSRASVTKEGYLQKELKYALDVADEKPEGTIFIIPLKLEECEVPRRLSQWQWASLPEPGGYERLIVALNRRAQSIEDLVAGARATQQAHLRSQETTLATDDAKAMVVRYNLYRAGWNEHGRGLPHQYETQVLQGALVVLDYATSLMWQRGGSGEIVQGGLRGAEEYVRTLNAQKFAGFNDWRLPTLEEAMSLMTTPEGGQPNEAMDGNEIRKGIYDVDGVFEKGAYFIWTSDLAPNRSTDPQGSAGRGWVVYFTDGICAGEGLGFNAYVRAVRSLKTGSG